MSLTNFDIINIVNFVLNKDLNGNFYSDTEMKSLINAQSQMLFSEYLGVTQDYQYGRPVGRNAADISRINVEELRPFSKTNVVNVVGGVADLSSYGMAFLRAVIPSTISGRGFDEINPDELADRLGDPVVSPTEDDPVFVRQEGGVKLDIYPSTITSVKVYYYKYPTDANFTITPDVTTLLPTYTSIAELEWSDKNKILIAYRILKDAGVNLENSMAFQDAVRTIESGK